MFLKYSMLSFGALPINFVLSNERCKNDEEKKIVKGFKILAEMFRSCKIIYFSFRLVM
jgi:hypothetical protein